MNYKAINPYRSSQKHAFESLCNQIFERWLRRTYKDKLANFVVVNGDGGDGGVESYGEMSDGSYIGLQAKYFTDRLTATQVKEIKNSIKAAKDVRPELKKYIICFPRDLTNKKIINKETKKTAENTDYSKVQALKETYEKLYRDFKLIFWGEHELTTELQKPENIGTRRHWFDKSTIDFPKLERAFEKSKAGWLSMKYVPNLHQKGFIQDKIDQHLYTSRFRDNLTSQLKKTGSNLQQILSTIHSIENDLKAEVGKDFKGWLDQNIKSISKLITDVSRGKINLSLKVPKNSFISKFYEELEANTAEAKFKNRKESLKTNIAAIDFSEIQEALLGSKVQYLIFVGAAGTGKTHALTSTTEGLLRDQKPAIIIQAKNAKCDNLDSILKYGFSSFSTWDEDDILSALESLSHSSESDRARKYDKINTFQPIKTVICLDGIDEARRKDWPKWAEIINTFAAQIKHFPRLQFLVTCRNSFKDLVQINDSFPAKIYQLPTEGDIDVKLLFDSYVNEYNAPNDSWIKYKLKNVLALKLFCQLYKNERGKPISISTSLTALIKKQLAIIQEEINEAHDVQWQQDDQILEKTLEITASLILKEKDLKKKTLIKKITKKNTDVDCKQAKIILETLCDHGILRMETNAGTDSLVDNYYYVSTFESIMEFIIARRIVKDYIKNDVKNFPSEIVTRKEIMQMATDILIQEHGISPENAGIWSNIEAAVLEEATLKAIPEVISIAKNFTEDGKIRFMKSYEGRDQIFEEWILKSVEVPEHPFNAQYLHEILSQFPSVFERDLIWSGPDYGQDRKGHRVSDYLKNQTIPTDASFDGLPLIFAWSLTSVDNLYRDYAKTQLTNWAHYNIEEYQLLLELLFLKYDPQLDEDLSLVLLGLASIQLEANESFKKLAEWIIKKVFEPEAIAVIKNAVIRHCCRAYIERSQMLGLIDKQTLQKSRPPYVTAFDYIPLDIGKPTGSEGQRKPITGDLAWYVIKDSYENLLEYGSVSSKKFLSRYSLAYGEELNPLTFSIAAGISYIKSQGWQDLGINNHTAETHGSLSRISTYPEKYVWTAVNYIKGYLADHLPYHSGDLKKKLKDYSQFLKLKNPANDISNDSLFPRFTAKWIIAGNLSPILSVRPDHIKQDIIDWVERPSDFVLKDWFEVPNGLTEEIITVAKNKKWIALSNHVTIKEKNDMGTSSFQTKGFLIKEGQFTEFLQSFKNRKSLRQTFEIDRLSTSPNSDFYISPVDAIWMKWLTEHDELAEDSGFDTITAISRVVTTEGQRETTYLMPSKILRNWLGIIGGNGKVLLSNRKNIIGFYNEVGESYYDQQKILLVDHTLLDKALKKHGYKIVWSTFMFRKGEFKTDKSEIYHQHCELSLVWKEETNYQQYVYHIGYNR